MSEKQRKIVWIAAVVIFLMFIVAVGWFIGVPMVRMAEDPEAFEKWADSFGGWGRLVFIGTVVLQVVVALIPGGPFELAAGYAYGAVEGTILCMIGFVIGSGLVFMLVRRFGVHLVEVFFSKKEISELSFLKNPKKTRTLALILMVIPGSPKDFLNYFAGLTHLKIWEWLLIVVIGRIPALVSTVVSGAAAGEENYILSIVMLVLTLLISAAGIAYYRWICKKEREAENNKDT